MVSRRKLEEEIARSTDPVIRKQLQELLDKREKRREEGKKTIKELAKITRKAFAPQGLKKELNDSALIFLAFFIIFIIIWIIFETIGC